MHKWDVFFLGKTNYCIHVANLDLKQFTHIGFCINQSKIIIFAGIMKLSYRVYGEGRPVLIFHGLFGMSDNWQSFARQMAENGYQVITADLRNHGLSPHDEEHDYYSMAADVEELITDLTSVKVVVVISLRLM
jgi:predicted alpha/beta-fold hydrolase